MAAPATVVALAVEKSVDQLPDAQPDLDVILVTPLTTAWPYNTQKGIHTIRCMTDWLESSGMYNRLSQPSARPTECGRYNRRDMSAYTVQCKSAHTTCCLMGRNTPEIVHSDPYHSNLDEYGTFQYSVMNESLPSGYSRHKKRNYQLLRSRSQRTYSLLGKVWSVHNVIEKLDIKGKHRYVRLEQKRNNDYPQHYIELLVPDTACKFSRYGAFTHSCTFAGKWYDF